MMGTGMIDPAPKESAMAAALDLLAILADPEKYAGMLMGIGEAARDARQLIADAAADAEASSLAVARADAAKAEAEKVIAAAAAAKADLAAKAAALDNREAALNEREAGLAQREGMLAAASAQADHAMREREAGVEAGLKSIEDRDRLVAAKEAEVEAMRQDLAARLERIKLAAGG